LLTQIFLAPTIRLLLIREIVMSAIEFNDQPRRETYEVGDEVIDRSLATEMIPARF
jgi:hypothetical protein